jgi:hypothetical protein
MDKTRESVRNQATTGMIQKHITLNSASKENKAILLFTDDGYADAKQKFLVSGQKSHRMQQHLKETDDTISSYAIPPCG